MTSKINFLQRVYSTCIQTNASNTHIITQRMHYYILLSRTCDQFIVLKSLVISFFISVDDLTFRRMAIQKYHPHARTTFTFCFIAQYFLIRCTRLTVRRFCPVVNLRIFSFYSKPAKDSIADPPRQCSSLSGYL